MPHNPVDITFNVVYFSPPQTGAEFSWMTTDSLIGSDTGYPESYTFLS